MKPRRVKFVWGAAKVIRGRWYLGLIGLYNRREGEREDGLAISVRGALLWGLVLAGIGWVALATAGFWIWQRNPYAQQTYTDALLYPLRRAEIAEKRGQASIAQGLDLARAGKWHDAAILLKYGLARYPRDLRGRLILARYYELTHQRATALRVLDEGLAGGYPGRSYLESLFNVATVGDDHEVVAEICARFLPTVRRDGPAADARWLGERRYAALTAAGRHAEALALAETETGETGEEQRVLSLLALDRSAEAIAVLENWRQRDGADLRRVARLEGRAYREAKRYGDMERALAELRERSPGDPAALVYAVVQQALAGRGDAARTALADYLFRFSGSVENLLLVATPLAEIGELALVEQCTVAARERGFFLGRFHVLLLDTHLARGDWEAAAAELAALPPPEGRNAGEQIMRDYIRLLIEAARSQVDAPRLAFTEYLRTRPWPLAQFRRSIEAMVRAGHLETARDISDLALRAYPASKWLQTNAAEVKLRILARTPALPPAPAGTAPATTSETLFIRRLESLLAARKWDEAGRHIAQVQALVPAPAWLVQQETAIGLAQVRIAAAQGEFRNMVIAARLYLNGDEVRSQALLEFARDAFAAGDESSAIALVREIVRRHPDDAAAQMSLREWSPETDRNRATEKADKEKGEGAAAWLAQVRARQAAGDMPGLRAAVRLGLTGDRARAEEGVTLAREFLAAGDRRAAEFLIREVLRRHDGFPPALRVLAEFPTDAAAKKQLERP